MRDCIYNGSNHFVTKSSRVKMKYSFRSEMIMSEKYVKKLWFTRLKPTGRVYILPVQVQQTLLSRKQVLQSSIARFQMNQKRPQ